jgi:hypothetical protein
MKKLALAAAAVAALAFTAPAFAQNAPAPMKLAQADVKVKVKSSGDGTVVRKKTVIRRDGDHSRRTVVIRHGDRGHHYGWRNRERHEGWRHRNAGNKTVIIKKRGGEGATVIKKKTIVN